MYVYRVTHLVANLGWVDLDLGSSPVWWPLLWLLTAQSGYGGTSQIKVNQMGHPVDVSTSPR